MTGAAGPAPVEPPPLPPSLRGELAPPAEARPRGRGGARWALGGLLALDLLLLLVALSLTHLTAEGPAKRSLHQSVAILTEVDAFLDERWETFREEAEKRLGQDERLMLPDFPVPVVFTPQEVLATDREGFRSLLLTRAADRVYKDGMSAFREEQEDDIGISSLPGALRSGMDLLRPTPHAVVVALTIALSAIAALLALGLVLAGRGYGRLVALGVSVSLAALLFFVSAIALRFALGLAADGLDDYLALEFLALGEELTWAPIRNGMIFSVGGGVLLALGATLALWSDRR